MDVLALNPDFWPAGSFACPSDFTNTPTGACSSSSPRQLFTSVSKIPTYINPTQRTSPDHSLFTFLNP